MNLSISLDKNSEILYNFLLLPVQFEVYQNRLKLRCWPLACTPYKAFFFKKKKKQTSRTSLPASFSASALKKNASHVIRY